MAISADHDMGLMTSMVTVTQNDLSPELIAHASRGPCAAPKDDEKIAYLLTRRGPSDRRPNIQKDATAAVLSFQRRTHAVKQNFLVRNKRTLWVWAEVFGIERKRRRDKRCIPTYRGGPSAES